MHVLPGTRLTSREDFSSHLATGEKRIITLQNSPVLTSSFLNSFRSCFKHDAHCGREMRSKRRHSEQGATAVHTPSTSSLRHPPFGGTEAPDSDALLVSPSELEVLLTQRETLMIIIDSSYKAPFSNTR